jgi:hypothetical protein
MTALALQKSPFVERFTEPDIASGHVKVCKVRIAVIGSFKMLRSIANARFGEAALQHRYHLRMSGKGRSYRSIPRAGRRRSLQACALKVSNREAGGTALEGSGFKLER